MRYTVEPDPLSAGPDDDFGFSETTSFFSDGNYDLIVLHNKKTFNYG